MWSVASLGILRFMAPLLSVHVCFFFLLGHPLWLVSHTSGIFAMLSSPFCLRLTSPCTDSWRTYYLECRQLSRKPGCKPPSPVNPVQAKPTYINSARFCFHLHKYRLPWALVFVSSLCLSGVSRKTLGRLALIVEQPCCLSLWRKSLKWVFHFIPWLLQWMEFCLQDAFLTALV